MLLYALPKNLPLAFFVDDTNSAHYIQRMDISDILFTIAGRYEIIDAPPAFTLDTRLQLHCPRHGAFSLKVSSIRKGGGCRLCSEERHMRPHHVVADAVAAAYGGRIVLAEEQRAGRTKNIMAHCECGEHFRAALSDLMRGMAACPACSKARSNQERDLAEWVTSLGVRIECNQRFDGLEFDIVCPEQRVAIEYHGLVWHAETDGKQTDRHALKYAIAKAHGYRLLQIYSDEWENRRTAVEILIRGSLGLVEAVHARSCKVISMAKADADRFLNAAHVQGASSGNVAYGLEHGGDIVAVMQFGIAYSRRGTKTTAGVHELARYASTVRVRGGASRLFSAFLRGHRPAGVVSYVDHRYFDGGMYPTLGFTQQGETRVDYEYLFQGKRWHKSSFKKLSIRNRFGDIFPADWTERQMADEIGARRLWNAGRTTFVWGTTGGIDNPSELPILDEVSIRRAQHQRGMSRNEKLSKNSRRRWEDAEFRARMRAVKTSPENVERIRDKFRSGNKAWWHHPDHGFMEAWHGDIIARFGGGNSQFWRVYVGRAPHYKGWQCLGTDYAQAVIEFDRRAAEKAANNMAIAARKQANAIARVQREQLAIQRQNAAREALQLRKEKTAALSACRAEKAAAAAARASARPAIAPGDVFGRLTIVSRADVKVFASGARQQRWNVKCECGTEKIVAHSSLKSGLTQSCGCLHRESSLKNLELANKKASAD